MRRFSIFALSFVLFIANSADLFARGSSSFSRSSSPSRSSSFSRSRSSSTTFSKPAPAPVVSKPASTTTSKVGTAAVVAASTTTPPKATATSATSVAMTKQNAIGAKTYTSRIQAEADFKAQQASKYTNSFKTQPTTRPEYIPGSISRGGTTYNVTYHNGGYGYYDQGRWNVLDLAMYMVVTDAMLNHNGYGVSAHNTALLHQNALLAQQNAQLAQQNAQLAQQNQELGGTAFTMSHPIVVHRGPSALTIIWWTFIGAILIVIAILAYKMF